MRNYRPHSLVCCIGLPYIALIVCHGLNAQDSGEYRIRVADGSAHIGQTQVPATAASDEIANTVCGAARHEMQRRGFHFTRQTGVTMKFDDGDCVLSNSHQPLAVSDHSPDSYKQPMAVQFAINQLHANCFEDTNFPSAKKCQSCHPKQFRDWSVSPHAYAQMSPVFNAMSSKLNELTNGTLGDFCIRCHTPIGMARNKPIAMSNLDRPPEEREGVTCVVCHRINQNWGKISGRQALVGGGLSSPIYGPVGDETLRSVLANPEKYGVVTSNPSVDSKAREIHSEIVPFFAQTTPGFCGACHDVFAPNGFRLEDAFSEFKLSPAARLKGQNCQDCHMGVAPGESHGYAYGPAAKIGNAQTPNRKLANHMMVGPDYPIIHPGIFPHNPKAVKEENSLPGEIDMGFATLREWLAFNHELGWGTHEFEDNVESNYPFPNVWSDKARRMRARDILSDQFKLLNQANAARHRLLSVGYRLGDIIFEGLDRKGLHFRVKVFNGTDGHMVPTGFDAERLVFLRTTVLDRTGKVIFISGDLDPNGDVRDSHSVYVHNGKIPIDRQLFTLQSRFLTRNVRGGEREQVLNVPFSLDPLPYVRPETRPFTVLGRPTSARKHKQGIEVGGFRWAKYTVDDAKLNCDGPYYIEVNLIAGMVPVNLIHKISSAGFDYGMSAKQVADAIVAGHMVIHTKSAVVPHPAIKNY